MGYSKLSTGSKFKGKSDPKNPRLKNKKVDNGNINNAHKGRPDRQRSLGYGGQARDG